MRGVTDAEEQAFNAAIAPAQHIDRPGLEMVDQRRKVVSHFFVGDLVGAVARLALVAAVHGDNGVMLAEVVDLSGEAADAGAVAMHQEKRFPGAVNFVIELDSVVCEGVAGGWVGAVFWGCLPGGRGLEEQGGEKKEESFDRHAGESG